MGRGDSTAASAVERFNTNMLIAAGRTRAWNDIYSSRLASADVIPRFRDFSAGLDIGGLGQLGMVRHMTGPCTITRTTDHIDEARQERVYSFLIMLSGEAHFCQGEREVVLHSGDVSFCDNGMPHSNSLAGEAEMLLVRVPDEVMRDYLPFPEAIRGRRLCARRGVAAIATSMACSLWRQVERGIEPAHADVLAHQLVDLFVTSYSQTYGEEMSGPYADAAVHARATAYIDEMIRDPGLSARGTAKATGITTGQLLAMFIRRGDSFGGYVSRRRLDQAARHLRNPRWRGSTISEVAYSVGYNSVPLFNRTFHGRFGVSPGDYRRARLN